MSVYSHFLHCLWSKLFALRDCWLSEVNRDLKEHIKSKSENVRSNNSKRAGLQEERALCASSAPPERTITYSRFKTTLSAALFCAKTNVSIAAETLILQNWAINNGFGGGTLSHSVSRTRPGGGRTSCCAYHIKVATQSAIEKAAATDTNRSVKCFYYSICSGGESFARAHYYAKTWGCIIQFHVHVHSEIEKSTSSPVCDLTDRWFWWIFIPPHIHTRTWKRARREIRFKNKRAWSNFNLPVSWPRSTFSTSPSAEAADRAANGGSNLLSHFYGTHTFTNLWFTRSNSPVYVDSANIRSVVSLETNFHIKPIIHILS